MKKPAYLFNVNFFPLELSSDSLSFVTPLGKIELEVKINHQTIHPNSFQIGRISEKSTIYMWNSADFKFEIIKSIFTPLIPSHLRVDYCYAYILRIKALTTTNIEVSCFLFSHLIGEPASGEDLLALTFEDGKTSLTIGTEDEDALLSRAKQQDGLPFRFFSNESISYQNFTYLKNGIKLFIPPLFEGEISQIQFAIAWAKSEKNSLNSTYFAVDIAPHKILEPILNDS